MRMNISMSKDAEGDGAWGTVFNRLRGFTFEVTLKDQSFVGRIVEADEIEVTFVDEPDSSLFADNAPEKERTVFISDIDEMEYV